MLNNFSSEFDPIFETINLLNYAGGYEKVKKEIIKSLSDLGFDGESFYGSKLKVFEHYVKTFNENCVLCTDCNYFFEYEDSNFNRVLTVLIMENRGELLNIDSYTDQQINEEVIRICNSLFDKNCSIDSVASIDKIITFLEDVEISRSERWKMLRFMQNPKEFTNKLLEIIRRNIGAYEVAKSSVSSQTDKLLSQLSKSIQYNTAFQKIKSSICDTDDVIPTLAMPLSLFVLEQTCYYGVYNELVLQGDDHILPMEFLLLCLKALGDKSKLDILCSLKQSSKYNLEMAEQMGLTAATMSHHMNVLLTCKLVTVSKQNSKVYYSLDNETIRKVVELLNSTLL
jgi:DNA-binding transcriptional ArsR family regulator